MRATAQIEKHPNAAVAFVSTGPAALIVWAVTQVWPKMPNPVAAAIAGVVISAALLAGRWVKAAAAAVNREGLIPCLRRLVFGPPKPPPAPPTP